jgi:hypothetical protein
MMSQDRIGGIAAHLEPPVKNGEINERKGPHQPSLPLLMFGSFGIDRYNSQLYLRKFKSEQLRAMAQAFRESAAVVEEALQSSLRMDEFSKEYTPLHPQLRSLAASEFIDDKLLAALSKASVGKLMRLVEEEAEDVYSFPVLKRELCEQILEEIDHFNAFQASQDTAPLFHPTEGNTVAAAPANPATQAAKAEAHQTSGRAGYTILDELGLTSLLDELLSRVMVPLARLLYADAVRGGDGGIGDRFASLDWRHGYVISYSDPEGRHRQRTKLSQHTDDCELTLNICLGRSFKGGNVTFGGKRGSSKATTVQTSMLHGESGESRGEGGKGAEGGSMREACVQPAVGRAIVHMGQHLHAVQPVLEGERHMLIMWCRSSQYRAACCPCCTINRRGDECVCSPQWHGRYVK